MGKILRMLLKLGGFRASNVMLFMINCLKRLFKLKTLKHKIRTSSQSKLDQEPQIVHRQLHHHRHSKNPQIPTQNQRNQTSKNKNKDKNHKTTP